MRQHEEQKIRFDGTRSHKNPDGNRNGMKCGVPPFLPSRLDKKGINPRKIYEDR